MAEVLQFPSPAIFETGISDAEARASALDITASWIVEAPAGSGKTGLLMQRFLKLLAEGSVQQPEEVLAITFTRKATAELRDRIFTELEAAHHDTPLPNLASEFDTRTRKLAAAALERGATLDWSLLQNPQRLRIRTIDALCAEIAGSLPLLSGSGGPRTPVEDASPLYRQAARCTLLQLGGKDAALDHALHTVLLHRDGSLADCESLLAKMLAAREQWAELVPLNRASLDDAALESIVRPRLEQSLANVVCAGLTRAIHALPRNVLHDLTTLAQRLSIEPGYNGDSPIAFCANRHEPPQERAEHLDHWLALINLLLTKEGEWRKARGITDRNLGFAIGSGKAQLVALLDTVHAEVSTEEIRQILCDVRCLPPAQYPGEQWLVAKALFHLLLHALAELKLLFAERGECDFAELALAAREALRAESGPADLATAAGSALRHLLVDEMQDTSSSQYELIELLTRSWDGHSQTLFLVGDPKQSIYLFRQARVERFLRTMRERRLGDLPVTPLRLTANFRSQARLVHAFNHDFSRIFPPVDAAPTSQAVDVPFVEATPVRAAAGSAAILWHTAVLGETALEPTSSSVNATEADHLKCVIPSEAEGPAAPPAPASTARTIQPENPRQQHAHEEAAAIRDIVEAWQNKPFPLDRKLRTDGSPEPWRIAILARIRSHLATIVQEFNRTDAGRSRIPYRALKVESLADRPEVLDALALTRALLHPADRVAWLAVLHAPWCGLGLADLLTLTGDAAANDSAATIPGLIESNAPLLTSLGQQLLHRVWRTLETALALAGRGPLAELVERTWRSLGGDATLTLEQLANVQRFFMLLRETEQPGGRVKLSDLDDRLIKLFAEPSAPGPAVDLLTIHTAKGLEWDVVIVPALEKKGQGSRSELLNWLELDGDANAEASVVLAPIQGKGDEPGKLYKWLNKVRCDREAAERKRLYYVACTRAREELHLFAACKRNSAGELRPPAATLLEACWPAAEERFAHLAQAPATDASIPSPIFTAALRQSISQDQDDDEHEDESLALAASAEEPAARKPPLIHRLPLTFNPLRRFADAAATKLPYLDASTLRQAPAFDRPEGGFAVRAFGNVVHRFLQAIALRLASNATPAQLLIELPTWNPRLVASLRAEGLSPAVCQREASRALEALTKSLADPEGRWLLSPQTTAASEQALTFASPTTPTLRVDRTFLAGATPLTEGNTHIWIVDFKTTQQGSRSPETFAQQEREKYQLQLESYANIRRSLPDGDKPIMLALYYPLVPRLIQWPSAEQFG